MAMANKKGMDILPSSTCTVIPAVKSDHSPLLITMCNLSEKKESRHHISRFEVTWDLREECSKVISDSWKKGQLEIQGRLSNCKQALIRRRGVLRIEGCVEK